MGNLKSHVYAVSHNMATECVSSSLSTAIIMFATMDLTGKTERKKQDAKTAGNTPLHKQLGARSKELTLDYGNHSSLNGRVTDWRCIKAIGMTCGT